MEIKKTQGASLEDKRKSYFLLGLIVALSLLFVALEYTTHDKDLSAASFFPDEMIQEFESQSVTLQKDLIELPADKEKPVSAERITVVEELVQDEEVSTNLPLLGETDGVSSSQEDVNVVPSNPSSLGEANAPIHFRIVERLPEFPGGMSAFVLWLTDRLQYPLSARKQHIQGRVVASFIVNVDGSVSDLKIVKSVHSALDREALRVLGLMPSWKPGEYKGNACRTLVYIPVVFKL